MDCLHPGLVELLPTRRLAAGSARPQRLDSAAHAQMLLAAVENAAGPSQRAQEIGCERARPGQRLVCQRGMADGAALRAATIAEEQDTGEVRTHHPLEFRGGRQLTAAGFNRRMRKTARPVVWKGQGAKSPRPD